MSARLCLECGRRLESKNLRGLLIESCADRRNQRESRNRRRAALEVVIPRPLLDDLYERAGEARGLVRSGEVKPWRALEKLAEASHQLFAPFPQLVTALREGESPLVDEVTA